MKEKKKRTVFIDGPVTPAFIADAIQQHSIKTDIGAHSIFLGQVRSDIINKQEVVAIEYSAYREMAEDKFHEIREDAFRDFSLTCMHLYHSLGSVKSGEISLFVFVSAPHRQDAIKACELLVERIKKEVPVWGKEIFANNHYQWKKNT
ncbi:MAG: molybdenum cofactor biosynthesis protein MoaE [Chitinophagaceae bacterium]|nr:molybdenum cofactor biosynthesis protein MoaE [Chitinophagaceae bacterium]